MSAEATDTLLDPEQRLENFDFLRGVFIFLALYQHFTVYLNYWFVDYFKEEAFLESLYSVFQGYMGVRLPADDIATTFAWIFTAWVSQIYLTLAAFNLSKRNKEDFKKVLPTKLKVFFSIYLFFLLESFIVAPNLGAALSFSPIMAWMVILTLIAVLYSCFGERGVFILLLLSFTRWLVPHSMNFSIDLEIWLHEWVHPDFEYDARIEYFLTSGCLGFLLGRFYYGFQQWKRYQAALIALGVAFCLPWLILGDSYEIDKFNLFATEHDLAKDFLGSLYIYGAQLILIPSFLWFQVKNIKFKVPFFHWVGVYSLLVFAFHRIFMVHIGGPLWAYITGVVLEQRPVNNSYTAWILIIFCVFLCWVVKITNLPRLISRT